MKWLKRILVVLLSFFLITVISVTGLLYWIFQNPKETYRWAEKNFFPEDLRITWDKLDFNGPRIESWNFFLDLQVDALKITKKNPSIDLKIDDLRATASVFPFSHPRAILHEVKILAYRPQKVSFSAPEEPTEPQSPFQMLQNGLSPLENFSKWVHLEKLQIEIPQLHLFSAEGDLITLAITALLPAHETNNTPLQITLNVSGGAESPWSIKTTAEVVLDQINSHKDFLTAQAHFRSKNLEIQETLKMSLGKEEVHFSLEGPLTYKKEEMSLLAMAEVKGSLTAQEARLELQGQVKGLPGPLVEVPNIQAQLASPLEEDTLWSSRPSQFRISAPVALFFVDKNMRPPLERACRCKIPEVLKADVDGDLWLSQLMAEPAQKVALADFKFALENLDNQLISSDIKGQVKIQKEKEKYFLLPDLNAKVTVHSFQGLQEFLKAKNILIPAPLDVLEGVITLSMVGKVNHKENTLQFPSLATLRLASDNQRVNVDTEIQFDLNENFKEAHARILAKIAELKLELPPLDPVKGKPRVARDQRILKAPKPASPPSPNFKLNLSLAVQTLQPGAIQLLHKDFFHPYIPMSLQVQRGEDGNNSGYVRIEPFEIEYLRHKIQVEKLTVTLSDASEQMPVDGRLRTRQTQYTVFIDITGTTTKPQIKLTSDPYLPEDEIISVLLYDRTSDQLISADAETAGNVHAAVADRAIGLFGLWAFATTPIKSFSYNPVTKVYTATVALADDVTARIGTNWEETTQVELRKRVSQRWMLTAAWTPATQDEEATTKLVLQWEKRF